jgi:hypothetical protein
VCGAAPWLVQLRAWCPVPGQMLWNKPGQQVTVFAEITDNTLKALRAILGPSQDGCHDTDW